jgi:hypothetical protein
VLSVSLDDYVTRKQFQEMMSKIGQMQSSMLRMETAIKEHITCGPQRQNQNRTNFSKKFVQNPTAGGTGHVAGLAVTKGKKLSCKQKVKMLPNAFPTSYDSDPSSPEEQQHTIHAQLAIVM